MSIDQIKLSAELFMDKTTILDGSSNSGKTTMMDDILYQLCPHMGEIHIISPTERIGGKTFSRRIRKPFIHYTITDVFLDKLWKRVEIKAAAHAYGNNIVVLEKLFKKLNDSNLNRIIEKVQIKKSSIINEIYDKYLDKNMQKSKIEEIENQYTEFFRSLYKKFVYKYRNKLLSTDLSREEELCIKYAYFNPRTLLIIDDVSSEMKAKSELMQKIFGKMFFEGRHNFLTLLFSIHDDKLIDVEFRKNSVNTIFMSAKAALTYHNKPSNGVNKDTKKIVEGICKEVFTESDKFCKLIYCRLEDKFYRIKAEDRKHDSFRFVSPAIDAYCDKVENSSNSANKQNEFYEDFFSSAF